MSLYFGRHVQACNDKVGSGLQEFSIPSESLMVSSVHNGIGIHLYNPIDQLEIERINFFRKLLIFLNKLTSQEFINIFWLSLGILLQWAFLGQEGTRIEAKIVIKDYNWTHLLQ